jgi:hypothetical protein
MRQAIAVFLRAGLLAGAASSAVAAEAVARPAPPPDLRHPKQPKLKSDRERFRIIPQGHTETGMLPDAEPTG